jgi:hypothetical protein
MVQDLVVRLGVSGFGAVFVVVGLYTMNRGRTRRARSERIADTETTEIRDLRPGTVEVEGTAHPAGDATVRESPITRTDALASQVEVEEWESGGQGSGNWETIHEEESAVPMTVDDGTGEVRVELPPDGGLDLEQARTEVGSGDEPPEPVRRYVEREADVEEAARHDVGPLSLGERRRYSEGVIEPGEEVYVLGSAREEQAGWGEREYVIDEPTGAGDFVLSDRSEADLIREGKRSGLVLLGFGGLLTVVGTLVAASPWVAA